MPLADRSRARRPCVSLDTKSCPTREAVARSVRRVAAVSSDPRTQPSTAPRTEPWTEPGAKPATRPGTGSNAKSRAGASGSQSAATPWGATTVVDEVAVPQRAGERRFSVLVQLLEGRGGERFVRFAYATGGTARRGPVTMRARDIARLRAALERAPALHEALGM